MAYGDLSVNVSFKIIHSDNFEDWRLKTFPNTFTMLFPNTLGAVNYGDTSIMYSLIGSYMSCDNTTYISHGRKFPSITVQPNPNHKLALKSEKKIS